MKVVPDCGESFLGLIFLALRLGCGRTWTSGSERPEIARTGAETDGMEWTMPGRPAPAWEDLVTPGDAAGPKEAGILQLDVCLLFCLSAMLSNQGSVEANTVTVICGQPQSRYPEMKTYQDTIKQFDKECGVPFASRKNFELLLDEK